MTEISRFGERARARLGLIKRAAAIDLWNRLTRKTPVDTGRARAAWNMSIVRPDLSVPPEGEYGPPAQPEIGEVGPGDIVIVSNNLPYISALNDGHSKQAPEGFVEQSVNETITFFDGIVRKVA